MIFWENAHRAVSPKRKEIRHKEYVATLHNRDEFCELLFKKYTHCVKERLAETLVLGDGAKWIWDNAETYFPDAIQILDFFHVSEYESSPGCLV